MNCCLSAATVLNTATQTAPALRFGFAKSSARASGSPVIHVLGDLLIAADP
jgi:hypothetical protein